MSLLLCHSLKVRGSLPKLYLLSKRCYSHRQPDPLYTSGRWVWNEEEQLREKYREFNIDELQKVAMEASSAGPCVRMEKLGEGSYNKSFKLTMENKETVVARILSPNAGPAFLTTASEVATMEFLRNVLHLPVPKVLAWNSNTGPMNPVGAEYIIMEHAPGKQLALVWLDMDLQRKIRTMEGVVSIQQKLSSTSFSKYGCLYFSKDAPPGSHPAAISGDDLSYEIKKSVANRFSIGPMVHTDFWNKERADMDIDRGPWAFALEYIQAPALREHISVIQRYLSLTPHLLPLEEDLLGAFLCHADFHTPNIFVDDDGNITSIIDWQSSWAGPLFLEGRPPHFLDYKGELLFELPENFKDLDQETQAAVEEQVTKSRIVYLYDKYTAKRNPILSRVFQYPYGKTLADPIQFAGTTWDRDILSLRETLIRIQKWESLDLPGKCPLDFSPDEIRKHYEDGDAWNEMQDFWDELHPILGRDGWTSHETYAAANSIYSEYQAFVALESRDEKE
ncbi:kinase-like domain-containing protein [Aspergillus varians]